MGGKRHCAAAFFAVALAVSAFALSAPLPAAAATGVEVGFVDPDRFSDDDFRVPAVRASIVADFSSFFSRLGTRYLKAGEALKLEVLDMELAGDTEPWRRGGWGEVRILRNVTPPRIRVRYSLRQNGKVVLAATETVTDINYMMNPAARDGGRFAFEKAMLEDWFRRRFVRLEPPRATQ
ncbi:DUF3016 domain-containing protein [Xanthobacter sp. KR7-65]|uniref:DUF3016 domain-containing protein n=1 Tax=Xanthobacter sp. KR7-65 TaxID=3156612 RepID=UPI0032B4A6E1